MSENVNAEIIAIGTELLLGEITDTNSVYLAKQLRNIGINLFYMTSVGDNRQRIADSIRLAFSRADVVITCGGLGPTVDDMTRQSIADATDRDLVFHQSLYDEIASRFASFKVTMTKNNSQQAYLPSDAITIENPVGTAPSFVVEYGDKVVISLPGVPREMKFLFESRIQEYLQTRYQLGIIKARILKTAGIGESSLDDMLGNVLLNSSNPSIGLAAHHGIIDIRMTAKADDEVIANSMLDIIETQVRARAGQFIFGTDEELLEQVLFETLLANNAHIAVAEAGITNGVVAKLSSMQFDAIISETIETTHPDLIKDFFPDTRDLSLRDTAHHIAQTISKRNGASAGIAILSYPDIDEDQDKNVATVVAVYANGEIKSREYGFGGKNPLTGDWVSRWAMAYVWRQLKEQFDEQ